MSSSKLDPAEAADWELPNLETQQFIDEASENAFNIKPKWQYEPPEEEAEEILPPTAQEIEQIRKAAFDEGFAEGKQEGVQAGHAEGMQAGHAEGHTQGFNEGKESGFEAGKQDADKLIETLEAMVQQLHSPLEQVNNEVKKQVALLAASLAKAVVHTELSTNKDVINTALEKGLAALPLNETHIQIHLHPDELAYLNSVISKEKQQEKGWTFVEKASLSKGGCEVVSQNNAVDVSVERRTRDVIDKFLVSHGLIDEQS